MHMGAKDKFVSAIRALFNLGVIILFFLELR